MNALHLRPLRRHRADRSDGFTLIELLVVVAIIAILTSITLGFLFRAAEAAKKARTKAMISRLHEQIMIRFESYRTRRLQLDANFTIQPPTPTPISGKLRQSVMIMDPNNRRQLAALRLIALRELMRLELPDRWTDVFTPPCVLPGRSGVANGYYARWFGAQSQSAKKRPTTQYQAAECLYLIVNSGLEDNTLGTDNAILADVADVDADGFKEFVDAWGNPIKFLRWAPKFYSDLQPAIEISPNDVDATTGEKLISAFPSGMPQGKVPGSIITRQSWIRHDPFDFNGVQYWLPGPPLMDKQAGARSFPTPEVGYALTPLIYSAGPDGIYDIDAAGTYDVDAGPSLAGRGFPASYNSPEAYFDYPHVVPARPVPIGRDYYGSTLGKEMDLANESKTDTGPQNGSIDSADNIHNHALSTSR